MVCVCMSMYLRLVVCNHLAFVDGHYEAAELFHISYVRLLRHGSPKRNKRKIYPMVNIGIQSYYYVRIGCIVCVLQNESL